MARRYPDATDDAAFYVGRFNQDNGVPPGERLFVGGCPLCGGPGLISEGRIGIAHNPGCERHRTKRRRAVRTVEAPLFRAAG